MSAVLIMRISQMRWPTGHIGCTDICEYCHCERHSHTVTCTGYNILLRSVVAPPWAQMLHFHHMSLRHLPHFAYNENIRSLRVNFCGLSHVHPLSLSSLPNLESLHLADNLLTNLPVECFFDLSKLRVVNLARNLIRDLDAITEMLPRNHILEQLSLEGNPVQSSSAVARLPLARQLYLADLNMQTINETAITFLPSTICTSSQSCRSLRIPAEQWSILRTLDLSAQEELSLQPSLLRALNNVSTLDLGTVKLPSSFPDWLRLSSLVRHLNIASTIFPHTNHSWQWCGERLESLDVSYTTLHSLIIPSHCTIRYLKANGNHLREVSLGASSLEAVFLERNELAFWVEPPPGIALTQLLTLSLASNRIRWLPKNALAHYPQLQHLDISHNLLANLSAHSFPSIGMQIRSINMSHNKLSQFTHPVLPSLVLLDLSSNALTGLEPDLLAGLPLLQHFYLNSNVDLFSKCIRWSQCWLRSLDQLVNLIDLDLSDCSLEWQPDLSGFQALNRLGLSRNKLSNLDVALLPSSVRHLDYPLRSYLDNVRPCVSVTSAWLPTLLNVVCLLLAVALLLTLAAFVASKRNSHRCSPFSFTYKPLQTSETQGGIVGL
ncbi:unnamed protein product [Gongylonema pulchrum]|uniref:LRRCT domain-containing protein n=1 Tax=Gongylonema pulchrum TaxID=637853 RepID=A0A183ECP9_9BILA|nr:unnamed protein product [Gongylonema pulchrum]